MTDEEKLVEYLKDDSKCLIEDVEGNLINITKKVRESFLAGLKAGRPKWHKVADGDLPKDDKYYLIFTDRRNYYVSKHHCNTNYWIGIQNQYVSIKNVVAWCEIPKYTEE